MHNSINNRQAVNSNKLIQQCGKLVIKSSNKLNIQVSEITLRNELHITGLIVVSNVSQKIVGRTDPNDPELS